MYVLVDLKEPVATFDNDKDAKAYAESTTGDHIRWTPQMMLASFVGRTSDGTEVFEIYHVPHNPEN